MLRITSPGNRLTSTTSTIAHSLRSIIFPIHNFVFALPIKAVFKIIPCPPIDSPIEDCIGLVEWEGKALAIVDLSQKFRSDPFEANTNQYQKGFLILTQTNESGLCGFFTQESPTLMDIPQDDIHPLPQSYREVNQLGFVSHMALLTNEDTQQALKIFLLGVDPKAI